MNFHFYELALFIKCKTHKTDNSQIHENTEQEKLKRVLQNIRYGKLKKGEIMSITNTDRYLKNGVNVEELAKELRFYVHSPDCDGLDLKYSIEKFFGKEARPVLSLEEENLLKCINEKYKYICRDERGYLYIAEKGKKESSRGINYAVYDVFGHLFKFILPRRRI